jgi:hypothetical protein
MYGHSKYLESSILVAVPLAPSSRSESAFGDDPRMPQQNKGNNNGNNYWARKISEKIRQEIVLGRSGEWSWHSVKRAYFRRL